MNWENHPWGHRIQPYLNFDYGDFVGEWLHDPQEIDVSNPVMSITNGWGAQHMENKWYADELFPDLAIYAYDSRGQGESTKHGKLDAVQGAIDANFLLSRAFNDIDHKATELGVSPGNKIIQGNCIGAMTVAALYAGKFPVTRQSDGVILISPVSTFDLPAVAKMTYFLPSWAAKWAIKYLAVPMANFMVSGEESEFSRQKALQRLYRIDVDAALRQVKQIFWRENVSPYWSHIDVPALMIVSPNDPLTRIEDSAAVYDKLQYPIWLELEAPDHLILEENIDFLRKFIPRYAREPWAVYEEYKDITPDY